MGTAGTRMANSPRASVTTLIRLNLEVPCGASARSIDSSAPGSEKPVSRKTLPAISANGSVFLLFPAAARVPAARTARTASKPNGLLPLVFFLFFFIVEVVEVVFVFFLIILVVVVGFDLERVDAGDDQVCAALLANEWI